MYNCCPGDEHMQNSDLNDYLEKLGLTSEEVGIYLDLCRHGESTPLLVARRTGINRTKVYRVLEAMREKKLVSEAVGEHTTRYSAAEVGVVGELLREKQNVVAELTKDWEQTTQLLGQLAVRNEAETKIRFYRGKSGVEQMVWNVLKAKSEVVGYTFRDLAHFVGGKFMEDFVGEFKRRNLRMRDIYGDEYLASEPIQYDWEGCVSSRYLPKHVLAIPHQMDIYDEVVTFYDWVGGEVWGTEIWNPKVAQMQKQLFELAWEKAKEV